MDTSRNNSDSESLCGKLPRELAISLGVCPHFTVYLLYLYYKLVLFLYIQLLVCLAIGKE